MKMINGGFLMTNKLKEMRFFKRKSQMRLQLETGINASLISRFECGYIQPTQEQKRKLARALRISVSELFPSDESRKAPVPPEER
jgi:transcriptional regulator with XRE-family HTH domain